jgi:hypothetical protein
MAEYRLPWFLAGIACFILAACIIAIALSLVLATDSCSEDMVKSIGRFDSKEAGVRAAIPKMAGEIARCPDARVYRVMWVGPGNSGGDSRHSILYERTYKRIGYEDDFLSSFSGETYVVDDAAIRAVADNGGTLEAFAEYDQRSR